ncbi:MAG: ribonuclease BN [Anaerolinea sp. 4484_236]|nr:MAG: ribonuclease BN [Anaerolinea sp. 4484_236]
MYKNKTVAVVVPAYNEEKLIGQVIETMPGFVDHIVVVEDHGEDNTAELVREQYAEKDPERIILIEHEDNQGVGAAIATGYKWCRDHRIEIAAVMAGDAQMAPADLESLIDPVAIGEVDYTKGNRLISGEAWEKIPRIRYLGNASLSFLTKIASGYWHIADSQTGYTAASLKVLETINLNGIYKRYGMPNDMLVKLNIHNFRVRDIPIEPVYGVGEESGIKPIRIIPQMSWLILRLFFYRMLQKYIIRDFHPLVFSYFSGLILSTIGFVWGLFVVYYRLFIGSLHDNSPLFAVFLLISGWQFTLFAMLYDMEYNRHLR